MASVKVSTTDTANEKTPKEYVVIGPPGTGKTHFIKRQVELASNAYGAAFVNVCSLTRTAAANIAQVQPGIPPENIGTIHSLAYRAVEARDIAETKFAEWNQYCAENSVPALKLSEKLNPVKDAEKADDLHAPSSGNETAGDRDLAEMNRFRARMTPEEFWPESVRTFATHWRRWKTDSEVFDFTDLLEVALRDVDECPGRPTALFVDESQDCSRLAFTLIRKWGEASSCLKFIHVGDPDQILFEWAGVDVESFFRADLPEDHRRVLHQSYRVPRKVHDAAVRWINQTPGRKVVHYTPRDFDGDVRRDCSGKHRDPIPAINDAKRYLDAGKTVMFCATCSYMLNDTIEALRAEGIPFHNPYRITRGDWNPLARGKKKTMAIDRLLAFLKVNPEFMRDKATVWTNADVAKWIDWVESKTALERGAKATVEEWADVCGDQPVDLNALSQLIKEDHLWSCFDGDPNWYGRVIPPDRSRQLRFPMTIVEQRGVAALQETPRAIVTTIHAVKGGEADVVYLFPDLSPNAHSDWMRGGGGKEGVRRAFYVGMTRARESLILLKPSSSMSVAM